ncbi:MAG: hypothetical protein ACRDKB_12315 [Actinomycetota bacterium]
MDVSRIAIVSREDGIRLRAAKAFDGAPASWSVRLFEDPPPDADVVVWGSDLAAAVGADGVVFDPAESSGVVAEVAARLRRGARIYAVVGAAGGVGATSIAFHLSSVIASSAETCYLEVDRRRGGLERAGLGGKEVRTWAEVGDDEDSLRLSALPLSGGFRALFAPRDSDGDPGAPLARARESFARVIVDDDSRVGHALNDCAAAVLVMTPTIACAHRARALLESWPGSRWAVVANRTGPGGEASRARLQSILGRKVALWLPRCPALRDAEDAGELVRSQWSPWRARVHNLARALERA